MVHVHDSSRPDILHFLAVESSNFGKETGTDFIATILGEKDWDVVIGKILGSDIESRLLKAGLSAPRVNVVSPEIDRLFSVAAVEVISELIANVGIIVGCVSDWDLAKTLLLDVGLGVADGSLYVG